MNRVLIGTVIALTAMMTCRVANAGEFGVGIAFSDEDIRIISAWYQDHGTARPDKRHGKKDGGLPPGIARNLQRGKPLPPGIAKQHLPGSLLQELAPPPRGFERVIAGGRILLVEIATQVIHDILTDVIVH